MTNVRWFGVYQHTCSPKQFMCGIAVPSVEDVARDLGPRLLYILRVRMKDGSIPTHQPSTSF